MSQFFEFEADFVQSLRCIPMQIRLKLDTCGVKLKLPQWNQLCQTDRALLLETPCETATEVHAYRSLLQDLVRQRAGTEATPLPIDPTPAWLNSTQIPLSVQEQATTVGATINLSQWTALTPLQRFALIKLSLSGHENRNFLPALKEFRIVV